MSNTEKSKRKKPFLTTREIAIYAMLGALMFVTKKLMEALPNIHLLGMFIMVCTIVFRSRALIPLYIYILADGLTLGFSPYWMPYLYIWAILWGITMLLPKKMPKKVAVIVYPAVCGIFGISFGALYAPAHALYQGLTFEQTLIWIAGGLGFDILHLVGNAAAGILVYPLSELLKKLVSNSSRKQA